MTVTFGARPLRAPGSKWSVTSAMYNRSLMRTLLIGGILAGVMLSEQPAELTPGARSYIEVHFLAAKRAETMRDFALAADEYVSVLNKYPKAVPEVYQNLGIVYYLARKYDEAIRTLSRGIRLKPDMVGAQLFLGASYLLTEQPEKALPYLKYAAKQKPAPESATYLGLAYTSLKQYTDAVRCFRFALEGSDQKDAVLYFIGDIYLKASEQVSSKLADQNPDSKYDHLLSARILDSQDWYELAAKEYLDAAKKDPLNASIFFPLGRLLGILGQDAGSRLALERYYQLVPADRQAALGAAKLPKKQMADLALKVDYATELQTLPPVPERNRPPLPLLNGDVNTLLRSTLAADRTGKWKQAVDTLVQGRWREGTATLETIRAPQGEWLRDYLRAVCASSDDYHKAEEILEGPRLASQPAQPVQLLRWEVYQQLSFSYFNTLLKEYPQSARAHFLKARTLDAQGKREALEEYQAAITADPTLYEARVALVDYYLSNAKHEEALRECQQALEVNPWSSPAKIRIGRIYVQLRQPVRGIPYLEAALRADPGDAQARADLARGFELQGELDKAIPEYRRALELDPSLNRLHYVLGRVYRKLGNTDLADREYRIFEQNESSERQKHLDRVRRLRESQAPHGNSEPKGHPQPDP